MPNWKKLIVSGSDAALNSLNITNAVTGSGLQLTSPPAQGSETTSLMIGGDGNVGTRDLGTNAFNSTSFTTCTGTVTGTGASDQIPIFTGTNGITGCTDFKFNSVRSITIGVSQTNNGNCSSILGGCTNSAASSFTAIVSGTTNTVGGNCSVIVGGSNNTIQNAGGFIGGGDQNVVRGDFYNAIVGGQCNTMCYNAGVGSPQWSFIGGGCNNTLCCAYFSTIAGGNGNKLCLGSSATIGGGSGNEILVSSGNTGMTISGGSSNSIINSAGQSIIGGGQNNLISGSLNAGVFHNGIFSGFCNEVVGIVGTDNRYSIIAGGLCNIITGTNGFIGAGSNNTISAASGSIVGGCSNTVSNVNSHIIGSGLTTDKDNYTFVNNLQAGTNLSSSTLTLSGLSDQSSEATALMISSSNVVGTRELGSNAFNSTAFTTCTGTTTATNTQTFTNKSGNISQWTNDSGYTTCTGTVDTSGTPVDNDFAKFTDANTIEGRSAAEMRSDLNVADGATSCTGTISNVASVDGNTISVAGNGTSNICLTAVINAVTDGGTNLATGDQIYDHVTTRISGLTSCTGTVTGTGTDNQVMTSTGGTGIQGESNLTYDGSTLLACCYGNINATTDSSAFGKGAIASKANTVGNTIIGCNAGSSHCLNCSVLVGTRAGQFAGSAGVGTNTFVGYEAGCCSKCTGMTGIGFKALSCGNSSFGSTAVGFCALACATGGGSDRPDRNTAIGYLTLSSIGALGACNTAVGYYAGACLTHGAAPFCTSPNNNTFIGICAGRFATTAGFNTAVGSHSFCSLTTGGYNIALGCQAGRNLTTGNHNIFIGRQTSPSDASETCSITIGDQVSSCGSNTLRLGGTSLTSIHAAVTTITSTSDIRDKCDIQSLVEGKSFLKQIDPISFTWNSRDGKRVGIKEIGFSAQNLLQAETSSSISENLNLTLYNEHEDKYEASPGNLIPILVKAVNELTDEVEALKARLEALE